MTEDSFWTVPERVPPRIRDAYREEFPEYVNKRPPTGAIQKWMCEKFNCKAIHVENPFDGIRLSGFQFNSPEELTAFLLENVA